MFQSCVLYCTDVMQKRSGEIISSRSASFLMHQRQVYGCERGDGLGGGIEAQRRQRQGQPPHGADRLKGRHRKGGDAYVEVDGEGTVVIWVGRWRQHMGLLGAK